VFLLQCLVSLFDQQERKDKSKEDIGLKVFLDGGWGSNPKPCIYCALSLAIKLSSQGYIGLKETPS